MALFGGGVNVDRSPGTQLGRNVVSDAQKATRRTAPIPVAGFSPFQQQAFDLIGQQGINPAVSAAQGFLPGLAGGQFVGQGPGQNTLQQAAGGGFSNVALPAAQSALDFSRGISGLPPGLLETAQGQNLSAPFINGEFQRISDPFIDQVRNVQFPGLQGQFGASGLRGTNRQEFLEGQLQDQSERALSGLAADLLGRERGFQQQAQLAIPGIQQAQLGGQLGAVGQLGGLQGQQIGAASAAQDAFARQLAQAGQFGLASPGFASGALGSQINPLLAAGGAQQAQQQQQLSARDEAIAREVQRAVALQGGNVGPGIGFQGGQSGGGGLGQIFGTLAGTGLGAFFGGPTGAALGAQIGGGLGSQI